MSGPRAKAAEKAALAEAERERKQREEQEKKLSAEWSVGMKDASKQKAIEDKELEKKAKQAEKAKLLAEEEAAAGGKKVVKTKKAGKDDCDLLRAALATQPKTKAQKEAEAKKKADEEKKQKELESQRLKAERLKKQEDEIRKAAAKGIVMNHTDDLFIPINNKLDPDEEDIIEASGFDDAIDALSSGLGKSRVSTGKTQFKSFAESRLPSLKDEFPGLKLSQYNERLFEEWSKSPENPRNQLAVARASKVDILESLSDDYNIKSQDS